MERLSCRLERFSDFVVSKEDMFYERFQTVSATVESSPCLRLSLLTNLRSVELIVLRTNNNINNTKGRSM